MSSEPYRLYFAIGCQTVEREKDGANLATEIKGIGLVTLVHNHMTSQFE